MANAGKGMGGHANGQHGAKSAGSGDAAFGQADLAQDEMGNHQLQAVAQDRAQNERKGVADEKLEPDENILDSFEKMDKDVRAEAELGKGNRAG